MDMSMNHSGSMGGSMAGELSSELLNQQLNDVRMDKDNILERLQIAETARFELQKMVTTLKEKHDEHVTSMEEKFEDSKLNTENITEEFHKVRDTEIARIQ